MEISTGVAPSCMGKRKGDTLSPEDSGEEEEGAEVNVDVEVDLEDSDSYWDKDSFDGREFNPDDEIICSDSKRREQIRFYKRRVIETKGFFEYDERLPDMVFGIGIVSDLERKVHGITVREFIGNMAIECVEKYNERKKKNVKFDHLLRANYKPGGRTKHYITFAARECEFGPLVEYQAKVIWCAGNTYPVLCRPSPTAYEKSKYEQSLESVKHFIAVAEKELELYLHYTMTRVVEILFRFLTSLLDNLVVLSISEDEDENREEL